MSESVEMLRQKLAAAEAELEQLRILARYGLSLRPGTIGGVLRQVREEKNLSMREMVLKTGLRKSLLSRVESQSAPKWEVLVKIAEVLETPLWEIVQRWEAEKAAIEGRRAA